jgi:hypothetical protein
VGGVEDGRVLDPQPGEVDDREEPPVGQLGVAAPPVDQLVVLPVVHLAGAAAAGARCDRVAVVVVAQLAVLDPQLVDLVVGAEHRDQHPAAGPVDVEPARVRRVAAAGEHVPPGGVGGRHRDAGVVGDDVEDQAEPGRAQRGGQPQPALLAAERRVGGAVVDHVVAVLRAGRGGQQRGGVEVADTEAGQIAGEAGGGVQVETG